MFEIGKFNRLKALRLTPPGMFLGKDGEEEVVLLPHRYIPPTLVVGDEVDVFIYLDSEDRLIATTQKPKIQLNQFACLEVKDVNKVGAFLDWGLDKDLMVPFSEQKRNMKKGESYLVYLFLDEESNRLVATSKIEPFLEKETIELSEGEEVDLLIGESSDIGVNVIINNRYKGLIYHNEIFHNIYSGDRTKGYIKAVREDRKIDVSLQQQGFKNIDRTAEILLQKLKANEGYLDLHDDSDPGEIMVRLQMSKKSFKKAVGLLYKKRLIVLEPQGIRLAK
jgi:predicted RNA-binding protein (virulence factor B family)